MIPQWLNRQLLLTAGEIVTSEAPGHIIQQNRKRHSLTQQEVGEVMGVRRETISRIENDKITPTLGFVSRFTRLMMFMEGVMDRYAQQKIKQTQPVQFTHLAEALDIRVPNLQLIVNKAIKAYEARRRRMLQEV